MAYLLLTILVGFIITSLILIANRNQYKEEHDATTLYKKQKRALFSLLGIIYFGFIALQLGRVQAITNFNYSLHEIMFVIATLSLYATPFALIIYIYNLIKYVRKRGKQKTRFKTILKTVLVIASIIAIIAVMNHQSQEVSTSGVFEIQRKLYEEGKYYLVIEDRKIRVSQNEYQLIEVKKQYLIHFHWNGNSPNKAYLNTIEPITN